ncbi:TPA: DUF4189 domain-containing protein [Stenotrophomonas maltophilia]|nr:DUF4189 domain-containing protein [Stenotrophomonas maltophilia]
MPTGKWETRWGAIAQDAASTSNANLSIGVAEAQKSKREAGALALAECRRGGGKDCKVVFSYHNQCAALAGPVVSEFAKSGGILSAAGAPTEEEARADSIQRCGSFSSGQNCTVIYSACSMSQFRPFR